MDGDGKDDVCFVRKEPERPQAGITYRVLGDDFSLTDGDSGYIECYIRMTRKWDDKNMCAPYRRQHSTTTPHWDRTTDGKIITYQTPRISP